MNDPTTIPTGEAGSASSPIHQSGVLADARQTCGAVLNSLAQIRQVALLMQQAGGTPVDLEPLGALIAEVADHAADLLGNVKSVLDGRTIASFPPAGGQP